jgi:hypothetical protein
VSNLGIVKKCEGLIAFRVDQTTIPPGTRLRRYYMHQYAQLIDQMQSILETGSASLAQYLAASEWQQLDLSDRFVGLKSAVIKRMVVLEAIFEHTREKLASHLPSRLDCVFVWPTLESAKKFHQQYFPEGIIHRCIMEGEAVELDGGLLPPGINLSDLSVEVFSAELHAVQLRAEKYWTAQESPNLAELLVVGNLEVVRIENNGLKLT